MAKKDLQNIENIDRSAPEKTSQEPSAKQSREDESGNEGETEVKNASASGLGSMGRSDEKAE